MKDESRVRDARTVLSSLFGVSEPHSVIDVGCGDGAWLQAALELDIETVLGVDEAGNGDGFPDGVFLAADLTEPGLPGRVAEGREKATFDLVLSIDTAQHLPFGRSGSFVEELCALGDVVLFAAAVPLQEGAVNEQWAEFWALHFRRCGFRCFDLLRLELWSKPEVEWRHSQNLLVFVRQESAAFAMFPFEAMDGPLSLIHPRGWMAGQKAGGDAGLAALSAAWMSGEPDIPTLASAEEPPVEPMSAGRELVLFSSARPGEAEISLGLPPDADLATTRAALRLAQLDLQRSAEDLATLRLDKADAEWSAREEFHLRMNMERDFLLADSAHKALSASNERLRQKVESADEERERLPKLMASLNRAIERERAMASQMADLRDAVARMEAGAAGERQAFEARVSAFFAAGSWRLSSPARAMQKILGHDEER